MEWYYAEDGKQVGPVSEAEFQRLMAEGRIRLETLVWRPGMERWQPFGQLQPSTATPSSPPQPTWGQAAPDYAGFWIRFPAKIIDNLIVQGGLMALFVLLGIGLAVMGLVPDDPKTLEAQIEQWEFIIQVTSTLLWLVVDGIYKTLFIGRYGATPGKMIMRLKVVTDSQQPVTYGRAAGRFLAELLSGCPTLFIGYIMAAFDPQKRALHDHLCGTRVVLKP